MRSKTEERRKRIDAAYYVLRYNINTQWVEGRWKVERKKNKKKYVIILLGNIIK